MEHPLIVKSLIAHAKKMGDWVRPIGYTKKMHPSAANAFLLGVMFDRSIKAERSWEAAQWINDSLGNSADVKSLWKKLVKMEKRRIEGFLRYGYGGSAFHRHYKTFARQLPQAAQLILDRYEGDPRKIWNSKRNVHEVRERLEEIPGIGMALSRMAVLNLARNFGLLGGKDALPQLDIKPDVHVMRVFKRCGLVSSTASRNDAIIAAQNMHPKFPAQLDAPAFDIGKNWCRPKNPYCTECPIILVCPQKIGETK